MYFYNNLNMDLHGNIEDYCITCLNKNVDMLNLNDNVERKALLITIFNIKFTSYAQCPQFLCKECDNKLNITYNFQQSVKECLSLLNKLNECQKSDIEIKNEDIEEQNSEVSTLKCNRTSENGIEQSEVKTFKKIHGSKVEIVPLEIVNRKIEDFKNKLKENKKCIICGFSAANRRAISSHMGLFHREEKSSWCLECNDIYENLDEHKQTHSKYQCPFCEQKTNLPHYEEHLQSHAGVFECDTCHKTFKTAAWLKKHKRLHTNEKPYICPNCSKSFIQISSLRYHIIRHGTFSCDACKKHYKTELELQKHDCANAIWIEIYNGNGEKQEITVSENKLLNFSSTELQNYCKQCGKRVKSLRQHINKCHMILKPEEVFPVKEIQCEFCEKKFTNRNKLKVHVRTHTGSLPYKCRYCDKRISSCSRLKDHERTHTKEKPFICNICGKALSQSSALKTHMKRHTGRPEVCELCNKRFCRKAELRLHLSKHMGEKPYLCTKCGSAFAQKSHLTEHMVGHSDSRPFQCPNCQKAFKKKNLLKEHILIHEGNKPFKCPSCEYACFKQYRLQKHMKQHTSDSRTITECKRENSD